MNSDTPIHQQLTTLFNLYEHHLDLFLKWITLYATVVAAIAVYIFNQDIDSAIRRWIPMLIAAASFVVSLGCWILWFWLKELKGKVNQLSNELGETDYPSFLGMKMTAISALVTAAFGVLNILYSVFGKF